jgi:hypothetical protein
LRRFLLLRFFLVAPRTSARVFTPPPLKKADVLDHAALRLRTVSYERQRGCRKACCGSRASFWYLLHARNHELGEPCKQLHQRNARIVIVEIRPVARDLIH